MTRALFLAAVLAALVLPAAARPGDTADSRAKRLPALEAAILVRVNELRGSRGLARLTVAKGLRRAATSHSTAMLTRGFFAHESPDGTSFDQRVEHFYPARGFRFWRIGENLAAMSGVMTADDAVELWLGSPPHRKALFEPAWREAGIGASRADSTRIFPGGGEASVVTLDFGVRR